MALSPNALFYVSTRSGFALAFALREWRGGGSRATLAGQLAADACHLSFFLGVASVALRAAVGSWWLALYAYALVWEAVRLYGWYETTVDSPTADDDTAVDTLVAPFFWMWAMMGVAPAIAAGFYLVYLTNGGPG
jgi:hypothetical protein